MVVKDVPAGATAVGIPARVILDELAKPREEKSEKLGFSAYAVARDDDPVSKAIEGLLDQSKDQDQRIDLILKQIEELKADRDASASALRWGERKTGS